MQDRPRRERADVVEVVKQGAIVFICGDGEEMAPPVHHACSRIYREATGEPRERESASNG